MTKKTLSIFLIATLMLAFTVSAASAACSGSSCSTTVKNCTGSSCSSSVCKTCTKTVCVSYMQCSGREYIKVTNGLSSSVNLKGWKVGLKCAGCSKEVRYALPAVTVKSCQSVWVYTGKVPGRYSLGTNGNILSCKGEVAKIYNASGKLVSIRTN